MQTTDSQLP